MSEPQRWRLVQGREHLQLLTVADGPAVDPEYPVEVMPVSEHERWRDAFLEGQRADHARCRQMREALERIVREDHEGGAGWMAEIAQAALDAAPGHFERGSDE